MRRAARQEPVNPGQLMNRAEYYNVFKASGCVDTMEDLMRLSEEEFMQLLPLLSDFGPPMTDTRLNDDVQKLINEIAVKEETPEEKILSLKNGKTNNSVALDRLFNQGKVMAREIISDHQVSMQNLAESKLLKLE